MLCSDTVALVKAGGDQAGGVGPVGAPHAVGLDLDGGEAGGAGVGEDGGQVGVERRLAAAHHQVIALRAGDGVDLGGDRGQRQIALAAVDEAERARHLAVAVHPHQAPAAAGRQVGERRDLRVLDLAAAAGRAQPPGRRAGLGHRGQAGGAEPGVVGGVEAGAGVGHRARATRRDPHPRSVGLGGQPAQAVVEHRREAIEGAIVGARPERFSVEAGREAGGVGRGQGRGDDGGGARLIEEQAVGGRRHLTDRGQGDREPREPARQRRQPLDQRHQIVLVPGDQRHHDLDRRRADHRRRQVGRGLGPGRVGPQHRGVDLGAHAADHDPRAIEAEPEDLRRQPGRLALEHHRAGAAPGGGDERRRGRPRWSGRATASTRVAASVAARAVRAAAGVRGGGRGPGWAKRSVSGSAPSSSIRAVR
jgi:hypothetical protein